jgi:extracellular elastinolytic metalloproteinase
MSPGTRTTSTRLVRRSVSALAAAALAAGLLTAAAEPQTPAHEFSFQGEGPDRVHSLDRRTAEVQPTAEQVAHAESLGATAISWNRFGTPHMLVNHGGFLSQARDGEAVTVARDWLRDNRALFGLSEDQVASLEVLRDSPLYDAPDLARVRDGLAPDNPDVAHVVVLRQRVGDLHVAWDGLVTLGVSKDGRIASVSSSLTPDTTLRGDAALDAVAAITTAAADVGMDVGELAAVDAPGPFLTFSSSVLDDVQRARPVAFPTVDEGLRRAFEVTLLKATHDDHGEPEAYIAFVDAETGAVWVRDNRVDHLADEGLLDRSTSEAAGPLDPEPRWNVFPANPPFTIGAQPPLAERDTRELWCWRDAEGCDLQLANLASRLPWDVNPNGLPSFTTDGNNASTAISHASFYTPDTVFDRPVAPDRAYDFAWSDTWNESGCDPATFATDNDDWASTTNLFAMHNRMHDWSYFLGFTEWNSNLQKSNFGNTGPERENDPELGSAQAGRLSVLGRDNANQITLQDGLPGITNQYLWQPLAGAFYGACADGAYDMAIVAHEYAHAISNRMTGGPDGSVGRTQGQSESWSDLAFAAYFVEYDLTASEDANRFALAPYAAGDPEAGIRNYGMNQSPLNYSNVQYDGMGLTSPHADSEIWSALNYDIMEALADRYDEDFPRDDTALLRRCADGEFAADACPGQRRWSQLMFDGLLLQPRSPNQVDSRDAMLAADVLRFDGANQDTLWDAFARRGLGEHATSEAGNDPDPEPSWSSPTREDDVVTQFELIDAETGDPVIGEVYVGVYEARITPAADTDPDTERSDTTALIPGTYELLARADGYGVLRVSEVLGDDGDQDEDKGGKGGKGGKGDKGDKGDKGKPEKTATRPDPTASESTTVQEDADPAPDTVVQFALRPNVASVHRGATAEGDGVNQDALIDDTEATNWASLEGDIAGKQVTVALAERRLVTDVQVSSMLRGDTGDEQDPGRQNRFSSLRAFDLYACDSTAADCADDSSWTRIYETTGVEFDARRPRPRVSDMNLTGFDVADTVATHVRLVVVDTQCTGNPTYSTEQNQVNDPAFPATGCDDPDQDLGKTVLLNPPVEQVRAAELQVFGQPLA